MLKNNRKYPLTKEEFKTFKKAWSRAVRLDKTTYRMANDYKYDVLPGTFEEGWERKAEGRVYMKPNCKLERVKGWLLAEHYILYNMITDRPLLTGFKPLMNPKKMSERESNLHMTYDAMRVLRNRIIEAKELLKRAEYMAKKNPFDIIKDMNKPAEKLIPGIISCWEKNRNTERVTKLLQPFGAGFTYKELAKMDVKTLDKMILFDKFKKPNSWF